MGISTGDNETALAEVICRMLRLAPLIVAALIQASANPAGYVSFCQIAQDPGRYDQKSVLTSGVYAAFPELANFVDPSCPSTTDRDVTTFPTPMQRTVQDSRGWKRMEQILNKDKKAFVVVRGVFDAYNRYKGPAATDQRIQDILEKGNSGFGHLGVLRFQLRIESVEFVSAVRE